MSLHAETDVADSAESTSHARNMQNRFMTCSLNKRTTCVMFAWDTLRLRRASHAADDDAARSPHRRTEDKRTL